MTDVPLDTMRPTGTPPEGSLAAEESFARSTASMTVLTAVSRLTGFVRIVVVAAVLGTTFLGNTYQSANSVPNLLFELIAAGVLQAVLIPTLVSLLDRGDRTEAEHVAGSVLGLSCVALAALAVVGIVAAPLVARGLFGGVQDPEIRADEIRLGTVFLWFFLPQVVMYAIAMVATSVLNAHNRFALPVIAPALNNIVVTASYGLFWVLRDGKDPSLDLTRPELLTLAGGTTLGVIAFCALPALAVMRSDFRLRPNLDRHHTEVRRIGRLSAWAALFLAVTQLLLLVVLVLANRVEGGVVAYQVGFTFFLLPHALFALPVLTASFPALSRQAAVEDWDGFSRSIERGTRAIAFFVLPASAGLIALAGLLAHSVLFGQTGRAGADQVAGVLVGFAPGLLGYGLFLFLSRVLYARHDTRTPALVSVVVALFGGVGMVVAFNAVHGTLRVPALALTHSVAYTAGAFMLYRLVRERLPVGHRPHVLQSVAAPGAAAVLAGAVMWGVAQVVDPTTRLATLAVLGVASLIGTTLYLGATALFGGPRPAAVVGLLRGRPSWMSVVVERPSTDPGGGRRVLQVLGSSTGGIRRHVAALRDGLVERCWAVEIAGPAGVMDGLAPLDHVVAIGRDPRAAARSLRPLARLIRSFDVVHAHGLTAGWLVSLLPRRPPLVVTVHNLVLDEAEGRGAPLLRRMESLLPARADAVIAISDQVARRFTGGRGADRITVVPPVGAPPEPSRVAAVRTELGVGDEVPLVVLVGRLHPQKDIGTLLEATVTLRRQRPDLIVALAGDGPERDALTRQAARLGLETTVRFLGERDDVADLMTAADVVVMCSVWESYGFVVAEALALGRPLVATAVGPVPELVIDGVTGRLVPPSDPDAVAEAVGGLLADPALAARLGSAGAQHLATKLDRGTLIDRVAAVYLDVLEDR